MRKLIFSRWTRVASIGVFFIATSAFYKSCGNTYSDHYPIAKGQVDKYIRDHPSHQVDMYWTPKDPNKPAVFLRTVYGGNGSPFGVRMSSDDSLSNAFAGSFSLQGAKGKDARRYAYLADGTITRGYAIASATSDTGARLQATAVVRFKSKRGGTVCMSFKLKATDDGQEAAGTLSFLGGTGPGARLYGSGSLAGVNQTGASEGYISEVGLNPRLGKARAMPSTCGKPPKVKVPTGNKVTAAFQGFTVSKSAPSASATLTAPDGTITSCPAGGRLYGVLDYSGPSGTEVEGSAFGGSTESSFEQKLSQGRNVIKIAKTPSNGSYEVKTEIGSTKGATLTGTTVLLPTFEISCS
jgi:hypothetical protein